MTDLNQMTQQRTIAKLYKHEKLLDTLLDIDEFFDSFDIYVYKNWMDGEVLEGPNVEKYWIEVVLKYDLADMPDPMGAKILAKHGCKVSFMKTNEQVISDIKSPDDLESDGKAKEESIEVWLVKIRIPRKFIISDELFQLQDFDDEVEQDVISQAQDDNIDEESELNNEADIDIDADGFDEELDSEEK